MVALLFLEMTQLAPEELHVSQPTPLISSQSSKDSQTVDPVDSNAKNEPVKEKISAYETPKQDKLKADITKTESKISLLTSLKESGFATVENVSHLQEARDQLKKNQLKLKTLIVDAKRQQKKVM